MMTTVCLWVLVLCFATLVYIYAGYPLCLAFITLWKRYTPPPGMPEEELPSVSMIVAAYNEELVIGEKIRNSLTIEYPPDKLDFIFVSDSTDGTNEILLRNQSGRVRPRIFQERCGKIKAMAAAFSMCRGDILVFSDANTFYKPNAIRKLVRHFRRADVGVVTGDVRILPSTKAFGTGERFYYRYERKLQEMETAFWATVAVDGAMYALRRSQLRPVTNGLVADDLGTGMRVARQGLRIIYDPEAIAEEAPTPNDAQEFDRKIRVVAYGIQSVLEREAIPAWSDMRLVWVYLSHKLLRWVAPVFLLCAFGAAASGAAYSPFLGWALGLQITFYLLALIGWKLSKYGSLLTRIPYYFCLVNSAALCGIVRGLRRKQRPVWERTQRLAPTGWSGSR
jgi:biofilm PGA synthesis N-glycosyltransferase PgaC